MTIKANPSRPSARFSRSLLSGILLAAASSAHAQTAFFWDADGDATTDTGGPGTWDISSTLWRSGDNSGPLAQWPNTDPAVDSAQFAGTADTVTMNGDSQDILVNLIQFGTTGYTIAGPSSGDATLTFSGTNPRVDIGTSISATISAPISGSSGFRKTSAGTLDLSGINTYTGTTIVGTTGTNTPGTVNVSGDQSAATGGWTLNGKAIVNFQSGSTIAVRAGSNITMASGDGGGARALNVFGTVTTSATSGLAVGGRSTLNLESGSSWTQSGTLTIRPANSGYGAVMNVKTGSNFIYDGTADIIVARSTASNSGGAALTINGGTFTTSAPFNNSTAGSGSGNTALNFSNGGTLKLSADITSLIIQGSSTFRVQTTNTAGGVIDTNTFNTAINVPVTGAGGLTKAGEGTLTLSGLNTYAGRTTVTGGTLRLDNANTGNDTSTVTIGDSGVLHLNFDGTDAVEKLVIGSTLQGPGVYGHSSTGATNGGLGAGALDAHFAEGTGTLTVGTPFQNFMAAYPTLTGDDILPDADPDGDGLSNVAEFIMGGTAPDSGSAANRPVDGLTGGHLTISLLVPTGTTFAGSPSPSATVQGVQVTVGGSLDLATFARGVQETALDPALPAAPSGYDWRTFRLSDPVSSQSRGFLRASFSTP
jgi:fibronectin-binding autotransporter adhesin